VPKGKHVKVQRATGRQWMVGRVLGHRWFEGARSPVVTSCPQFVTALRVAGLEGARPGRELGMVRG
jgi:hypothetical protein